jgi:hypothetical protein
MPMPGKDLSYEDFEIGISRQSPAPIRPGHVREVAAVYLLALSLLGPAGSITVRRDGLQ